MNNTVEETETYTKEEILDAIREVEDRLAGIRYILGSASIPDIEVSVQGLRDAAGSAKLVSRKKGC